MCTILIKIKESSRRNIYEELVCRVIKYDKVFDFYI